MNCPACSQNCDQETYEGLTIDVCPKCRGVWLDHAEINQIVKTREKKFKPNDIEAVNRLCGSSGVPQGDETRDLACPKCGKKPMKTLNYNYSSGIIVDRCDSGCGFWLDADELEKVQIHAELWQDKLEANRDRFTILAGQVENDMRSKIEEMDRAAAPSRFRLINSILMGLVKF